MHMLICMDFWKWYEWDILIYSQGIYQLVWCSKVFIGRCINCWGSFSRWGLFWWIHGLCELAINSGLRWSADVYLKTYLPHVLWHYIGFFKSYYLMWLWIFHVDYLWANNAYISDIFTCVLFRNIEIYMIYELYKLTCLFAET